jgi:tetratricopeptide (TPR) repeat protein/TolB-like protein/predicted Ser/Thr protein kinase
MDQLEGRILGHYRILHPIGSGGMGQVYLAEDERLSRKVALKIIASSLLSDESSKQRLFNEARAAAKIDHPSVCTVYDVTEEDGVTFIVMKYVEGESLAASLLARPFSEAEVLRIGTQVAEALAEAHAAGIVHRDIKPQNVMLTPRGRAVVLDFGLARLSADEGAARLTRTGQIVGTPAFMSPEQISGGEIDARSDIFSLGVVLYEMLAGRPLFDRLMIASTIAAVLFEEPQFDRLPPRWSSVLTKMLAKDPGRRYADMNALLQDLGKLEPGSSPREDVDENALTHAFDRAAVVQAAREESKGVAVLPFRWIGDSAGDDVLAEGLTEAAIDALSHVSGLRVLARSTVFRLGTIDDYGELGRRFNIQQILTGDLRERAGAVVVTLELVDAASGARTWGSRLEKPSGEIASLHSGIGSLVVEPFVGAAAAHSHSSGARDPEAFRLYLAGRQQWNRRTAVGTRGAVDSFQQAIDIDPSFAAAYAGLGDSLAYLAFLQVLPPRATFPRARAAAERALSLDPKLGEAITTLAYVRTTFDFDFRGGSALFREALSVNPNYAQARNWLGIALANHGDFAEADAELARAVDLDPLSTITSVATAFPHYYRRDFDKTLRIYRDLLEIDPNFAPLLNYLGNALAVAGQPEEALRHLNKLLQIGESPLALAGLGFAHARAGDPESAREVLRRLDEIRASQYSTPFAPAVVHAGLGEIEEAFAWLDRCLEERMPWLPTVKYDPRFDSLRDDPRFDDFLERVGFWS